MTIIHYKNDDLVIRVPVTFEAGASISSLIGGTVDAVATDGYDTVVGTGVIEGDGVTVVVTFAEDVFKAGVYELSVRVTVGSITQTVGTDQIIVNS